ncbi:MAG TPA: hypothetical protein VEB41_16705, partial [Burkholderiales bacterium]|nr:hypothetical protein [Burkholderiales bacterium]
MRKCVCLAAALAAGLFLSVPDSRAQDAPVLSVRVLPRIGLFDSLDYRSKYLEPRSVVTDRLDGFRIGPDWKPLNEDAYAGDLPDALRSLFPGEWQLLTTEGQWSSVMPAYRERFFNVSLRPDLRGRATNCRLAIPGIRDAYVRQNCTYGKFAVATNRSLRITLTYDVDGQTDLQANALVPEDFLIVVLGDSFASGEGNPDVPDGFFSDVRWKDRRCHRSAWAGATQAALKMMRSGEARFQHGAFTLINIACSGAQIETGLYADYEGAIGFQKYLQHLPLGVEKPGTPFLDAAKTIPAQMEVLRKLLDGQVAEAAKRTVDAMVVSGSGNDLYFAPLLTSFITHRKPDPGTWKAFAKQNEARFEQLSRHVYPHFRSTLRRFQGFDGAPAEVRPFYAIEHLLVTEYPDPVRKVENPSALADFCASRAIDWLPLPNVLAISPEESRWAYENVVLKVNEHVRRGAESIGGVYVGGIASQFVGRGLCAEPPRGAYAVADRYFRSASESLDVQGNVNG